MTKSFRAAACLATVIACAFIAAGCRNVQHHTAAAEPASPVVVKPAPAAPPPPPAHPPLAESELLRIKPNELGRIPVLMYHAIGAHAENGERYDRHGLNIAPDTLRDQLELMYEAGWYPVNMRDALTAKIDVPLGKTPVVLTFDDARGTQFVYRKDGTIDPDCGVAILEELHAQHPDWPLKASFYVLPRSKYNPTPFYQEGLDKKKLNYLVSKGFEVANHSTSHRMMARLSANDLKWEMAQCCRYIKERAPEATMDTMALPGGSVPKDKSNMEVLLDGIEGGTRYSNKCILRAWGGATLPPGHKDFDRRNILRIGSEPGYIEGYIKRLSTGEEPRYVSDGDPDTVTIPKRLEKCLDKKRTQGLRIVEYEDRPAPKQVAVIKK